MVERSFPVLFALLSLATLVHRTCSRACQSVEREKTRAPGSTSGRKRGDESPIKRTTMRHGKRCITHKRRVTRHNNDTQSVADCSTPTPSNRVAINHPKNKSPCRAPPHGSDVSKNFHSSNAHIFSVKPTLVFLHHADSNLSTAFTKRSE